MSKSVWLCGASQNSCIRDHELRPLRQVFGVCCEKSSVVSQASAAAAERTNEVEPAEAPVPPPKAVDQVEKVDQYMVVEENEEEEGPGLMDRSHVQFVPPRGPASSRRPTVRYPWQNYPTHPPIVTHPPSHTNYPWWTTKGPGGAPATTEKPFTTVTRATTKNPWWSPEGYPTGTTQKPWTSSTTRRTTTNPWWPPQGYPTSTTTQKPWTSTTRKPTTNQWWPPQGYPTATTTQKPWTTSTTANPWWTTPRTTTTAPAPPPSSGKFHSSSRPTVLEDTPNHPKTNNTGCPIHVKMKTISILVNNKYPSLLSQFQPIYSSLITKKTIFHYVLKSSIFKSKFPV